MRKKWSQKEIEYLKKLYEEEGLSLLELYPFFLKKYDRTTESVKLKIKKLKFKHTKEQTTKIKSRLNIGEKNSMFGKPSPMRGKTKENSEIIRNGAKKLSITKKEMHRLGLLPDINGDKNPMFGVESWNKGKTKYDDCRILKYGINVSIAQKNKWLNKSNEEKDILMKNLHNTVLKNRKPTKIENKIETYVKFLNIDYIKNYRISNFFVDFYLPKYNLVLECDGDYWHSNPKFYSESELNEVQIKNRKRDNSKNNYLKENKISFIRFWECDIHNDFEKIKLKILENLQLNENK